MTTLSKFTPAEALLFTEGEFTPLRQLLKLTFIDLFVKQVVKMESSVGSEHNDLSPVSERYVVPGKNFITYRPLPHETVFTKQFEKYPNTKLLFRFIILLAYKQAVSKEKYIRLLCKSHELKGLIRQNFLQRMIGNFSYTATGEITGQQLVVEKNELERRLPVLIKENSEEAFDIARRLKGNFFLLANMPAADWNIIDKQILAELNKTQSERSGTGCGGTGCGTWGSYNEYSTSFDSGCGSSDGNSGCGGDSGCSGCGGGCGGGGD